MVPKRNRLLFTVWMAGFCGVLAGCSAVESLPMAGAPYCDSEIRNGGFRSGMELRIAGETYSDAVGIDPSLHRFPLYPEPRPVRGHRRRVQTVQELRHPQETGHLRAHVAPVARQRAPDEHGHHSVPAPPLLGLPLRPRAEVGFRNDLVVEERLRSGTGAGDGKV